MRRDPNSNLLASVNERDDVWPPVDNAGNGADTDAVTDVCAMERDRLDALIAATPAVTLAGMRAKARSCRLIAIGNGDFDEFCSGWPLLRSLARDLHRRPPDAPALREILAEFAGGENGSRPAPSRGHDRNSIDTLLAAADARTKEQVLDFTRFLLAEQRRKPGRRT